MNSIAIQSRTETGLRAGLFESEALRTALGIVILSLVWISPTPFASAVPGGQTGQEGNIANQLVYGGLAMLSLGAMLMLVHRRVAAQIVSLGWLAMIGFVVLSGFTAPHTGAALRSVVFALFATGTAASVMFIAPNARSLSHILLGSSAALLALCYAGIVLSPQTAIHQGAVAGAIHDGLWHGVFSDKNIAGPVMASVSFIGIYLMRRGRPVAGALIALAATIFVWKTGSKTTAALLPVVVCVVLLPRLASMRSLSVLAILLATITIHSLTIGTVFVPFLDHVLRVFSPDTTFTGRIEIWELARDYVTRHPWTGYGYDSFWLSPVTENAEQPIDRAWDPRGIVTGHNGFLDLALFMGFPAMFLGIWLFVLQPLWQYMRTPLLRENVLLADLCLMIVAFTAMNSALESFFFRRADPVWLTLVLALFGLRLCSRVRIAAD